jgi:membrane protein DedA with SNARE-associated domain
MPLLPFTFFTALGAGIWSVILALVGFSIARSAGDISYLELCMKGKTMAADNLPLVIVGALALAGLYILATRLVMGRGGKRKE